MKYIKSNGTSILKVKHPCFIYRKTSTNVFSLNTTLQILHVKYITKHFVSKVETCNYQWSCKYILYIFVIRLMMANIIN